MTHIIGDQGKRRYNRNLARQLNEAEELKKKKEGLEKKLQEAEKPSESSPEKDSVDKAAEEVVTSLIFQTYQRYLKNPDFDYHDHYKNLTASQIEEFSKNLIKYKDHQDFETLTGDFLTELMRCSAEKEFKFNFEELNEAGKYIVNLGFRLKEKTVKIEGDVGNRLGEQATKCRFYLEGSAKDFLGFHAIDCFFEVGGDVGEDLASQAVRSHFRIKGETEESPDRLKKSIGNGTIIYQYIDGWRRIV